MPSPSNRLSFPLDPLAPARRRFLRAGAGAVLGAGLPPLLAACGGGDDPVPAPAAPAAGTRTLFFNHAHLAPGRESFLQVGNKAMRLVPIAEAAQALARERRGNRFLASVADGQVTHVVEAVPTPSGYTRPMLAWSKLGAGAITIDAVYLVLPTGAAAQQAFERARQQAGDAPPYAMTPRRLLYGVQPPSTAQELADEYALMDPHTHAESLCCWHPDAMSLDGAAGYGVMQHASASLNAHDLATRIAELGTAQPAQSPDQPNPTGWATLQPMLDAKGQPRVIDDPADPDWHGRTVYWPQLHPDAALLVSKATDHEVMPAIHRDTSLGADISAHPAGSSLRGTLWHRSDGTSSRAVSEASAPAAAGEPTEIAVNWINSGNNAWFELSSSIRTPADGTTLLDFTFTNKALRYLACYIEFEDRNGQLLTLGSMPGFGDKSWITSPAGTDYGPATATRQYLGVINPIGTIFGIPVYTDSNFWGSLEGTLELSADVAKIRIFAAGMGSGEIRTNDGYMLGAGTAGTAVVNYVLTLLFGVLGAVEELPLLVGTITLFASATFNVLGTVIADLVVSGTPIQDPAFWRDMGWSLLNTLLGAMSGDVEGIGELAAAVAAAMAEADAVSAVEKAIPLVGLFFNIASGLIAVADVSLTTVQCIQSPPLYLAELSLTHAISVTLEPDCDATSFPLGATTLKAVLSFDASLQTLAFERALQPGELGQASIVFELKPGPGQAPIPRGGKVSIAVQFLQKTAGGDVLLGTGSTGSVANIEPAVFTLRIAQRAFPVGAGSTYVHEQRLYLAGAGAGQPRTWVTGGAPVDAESMEQCSVAGNICQFNGLIVRQGTSSTCGAGTITALGYGWRALDGSGADVERLALLDADHPGVAFLQGYAPLQGVEQLAFSRGPGGADNFYVDGSSGKPIVRGVTLDGLGGPSVDGPQSNRAYGVLNLPSAALLVHPSGSLVSVAAGADRIELLRPAPAAVDDASAGRYRALTLGIGGRLPGQFSNVLAATIAPDGTLLVLEGGLNNRLQAFDLGMNPVRWFPSAVAGVRDYTLTLDDLPPADGWQHLDVQAEMSGLIYLLSRNLRQTPALYRLTIYSRNLQQLTALTSVDGVNARRIGLDHWRTLYTLNRAPLRIIGSNAQPAMPEPSISRWLPQ